MSQQYVPARAPVSPGRPRNGAGTGGFVLGLLGFLISVLAMISNVPITAYFLYIPVGIPWPLVVFGTVLSGIGLTRASAGKATNGGLAGAGLLLSAAGLVLSIV